MFLSLMSGFSLLPASPMIVSLQDPPVRNGKLPSFSSWKCFHPSHKRPRVAFYVHPHLIASTSILPVPSPSADLFSLDIFAPSGLFDFPFSRFRIMNAYSTHLRSPPYRTLTPPDLFPLLPFPLLVLGDFNIHHPSSDPLRTHDPGEMSVSHPYFSLASERGFSLLNQPGVYTHFPFTHTSRPSVLDLAFSNSLLAPAVSQWDTPLQSTGSDHVPIVISLCSPKFRPPDPTPNWTKADWGAILPQLPSLVPPPPLPPARYQSSRTGSILTRTGSGPSLPLIPRFPGPPPGPNRGGRLSSRPYGRHSIPPPGPTSRQETPTITLLCVLPAGPTSVPLRKPSSPTGRSTSPPFLPPPYGKQKS